MSPARRWSWHVGTLGGIPLRVHLVTLLVLTAVPAAVLGSLGPDAALGVLAVVGLALFSVLVHELGHALCARRCGLAVECIQLGPFLNAASLQEPRRPWDELRVAAAGPAANLVLAAAFLAAAQLPGPAAEVLRLGTWINAAMALGNLVPCFPLDGARMLRSALGLRWSWVRATRATVWLGALCAAALLGIGIWKLSPSLSVWLLAAVIALSLFESCWKQGLYAWARELSLQERDDPQPDEWRALDSMTFERTRKKCVSSQRRLDELSLSP